MLELGFSQWENLMNLPRDAATIPARGCTLTTKYWCCWVPCLESHLLATNAARCPLAPRCDETGNGSVREEFFIMSAVQVRRVDLFCWHDHFTTSHILSLYCVRALPRYSEGLAQLEGIERPSTQYLFGETHTLELQPKCSKVWLGSVSQLKFQCSA